ncbi:hypothetical protein KKH13_03960, partial [Patescibacteria group bacterium]|nr:hypothetical protein [Patescibacteria group bacterium]
FQWLKIGYGEPAGFLYQERPWLKGINQFLNNISRVFKAAQPYAQNFFNPGFFFGFGLVPILTPSMGFWAYVAGPTLGSAGWLASTRIAAAILPKGLMSPATFMAKFNALGWSGYFIGQVTGWIFFGWNVPLWYTAAWTFGVPMFGLGLNLSFSMIANALGMTVSSLVQGLLGPAYGAFAGAMAIGSTIAAVLSIASLTIFTGFVIYAGFWVPMIEESKAGQQSSNFYISNNCTQTGTNQYNCCSNFNLTENVLNSRNFLDHNTDFAKTDLTVDLNDPEATTDAFRGIALIYTTFVPQWVNGTNYSLVIPPGNIVGGAQPYPHDLYAFLPTPTDQAQTLKELMQQNQSVVYSMKPFFDILTALAKEHQPCLPNPKVPCSQDSQLIAEYKAQLALMKKQKELVDDLIPPIEDGKLDKALSVAMGYDPCPDPNQPCPEEKQGLKTTVNRYVSAIKLYLSQTDPDLTSFLAQLEQELKGLEQQIDLLPGIINQMEEIQKDMADADAAIILDPNFSFYNFSDEVWRLLNTYFSDAFNTKNNFYFIPQGTNYQVCVDTQYTGPIPASPQTVCSTISYTPSVWGPNTAFAKACTTFTPQ